MQTRSATRKRKADESEESEAVVNDPISPKDDDLKGEGSKPVRKRVKSDNKSEQKTVQKVKRKGILKMMLEMPLDILFDVGDLTDHQLVFRSAHLPT